MPEYCSVLLVEDNAADRVLIKEMIIETGVKASVTELTNGAEALSFLKREGKYTRASRPQMMILDLNMPRMNGSELIEAAGDLLDGIEILIMSGSPGSSEGPHSSYRRIVKPSTNDEFNLTVAIIRQMLKMAAIRF
jgi:CheY-like chemotaxis protein